MYFVPNLSFLFPFVLFGAMWWLLIIRILFSVFTSLNVTKLDSLVLACKLEPSAVLSGLQDMWSVIESMSQDKRFGDVGVSDIDTDVFIAFYNWAKVILEN